MKVWYAIPSINAERASHVFAAWKAMGYKTAVLIDRGNPIPKNADLVLEEDPWPGYFRSVNLLAEAIGSDADILVTGGDDVTPDFKKRAEKIAEECFEKYPDGYFVMQPTGDDMPGKYDICTSPWIGKGWLERAYGGKFPLYPEYMAFFGDQELREVSYLQGVLWQRDDLIQYHDHWIRPGGPPKLDYQKRNDKYWPGDEKLFRQRKKEGFPGHQPICLF